MQMPLSDGVAVFRDGVLIAFAYSPVNRGHEANECSFRMLNVHKSDQSVCQAHYGLISTITSRLTHGEDLWRQAHPEDGSDIIFCEFLALNDALTGKDTSAVIWRNRLALQLARRYGFAVDKLPDGYLERDRATRHSIPGRLTPKKLETLIQEGRIKKDATLHCDPWCKGLKKDLRSTICEVARMTKPGQQHLGRVQLVENPLITLPDGDGEPYLLVDFPHAAEPGYLQPVTAFELLWRDDKLVHTPVRDDDEWLCEQYLEAEAAGRSW